ncbi:MAG: FMN-binding protein [Clostridia bacterium]|nr:FMN-binding protein [Clostridia bacterium]
MKKDSLKSIIVLVSICLVVGLLLSGVNSITAPIIEKNDSAAANGAYLVVLPNATTFEDVIGDFPETVLEMKKDAGGSGFAFKIQGSSSYSQSPLQMILGIDNEGKITKLVITNYAETKGNAADFEALFVGKDATMTDVVAGVTYTTNAIKDAVKAAYDVFFEYADIEKSDEQKLQELYGVIMPNATDKTGAFAFEAVESDSAPASVTGIYASKLGIGYIMTVTSGDKTLVIGVNAYGKAYVVYDIDGNDLSADASYDAAKADAEAAMASIYEANHDAIVAKMVTEGIISSAADAQKVDFSAVSSRVVAVYKVSGGLAYVAKAEGFGGLITVCYVINDAGEIVKYATLAQTEVAYENLYGTYIAEDEYAANLTGKTVADVTDDTLLIAGSTFTTNATKLCWNDIKAAHEILNGEVQ